MVALKAVRIATTYVLLVGFVPLRREVTELKDILRREGAKFWKAGSQFCSNCRSGGEE